MANIPFMQSSSKTRHTATDETDIYKDKKRFANERWHSRDEINFINHVVLVWLHRVRRGDRTITIPDAVIKAKGKEAANIINYDCKFYPTKWLRAFMKKLEQEDARGPKKYPSKHLSVYIEDIVKAELPKFFDKNAYCMIKKTVHEFTTEERTAQADSNILSYNNLVLSQLDPEAEHSWNFIYHVVMIWLHQARQGDSTISLPESAIRARVIEAADIVKKNHRFDSCYWMRMFNQKLKEEDVKGLDRYSRPYLAIDIRDIIKAEQVEFFTNACQNEACGSVDAEMNILSTDDTIQTYDELLDCLRLIHNYAINARNTEAVVLVTQIEEVCMANVD